MNLPWWGIPVLLVVGVLVIAVGWWWDRRRLRAESAGFTTEEDLGHQPPPGLPDADVTALLSSRGPEPTLPGGLADRAFLTHPKRGVAVVRDPMVVVTDAELDDERLILSLLDAAATRTLPLVLVAPGFGFGLLGTLRANLVTGRVTTLPIELADPDLLARAAALCGTTVTPDADLRSGWLPPSARGTCATWIADADDSWVEPTATPNQTTST